MAIWHIIPTNDLKEHEKSSTCECRPSVEIEAKNGDIIVVHNAYDERELAEPDRDAE